MGDHQCREGSCPSQGLYRNVDEHDSCGIGFVADIKGRRSHEILQRGLEVLERMEHRGAESADNNTGDGAGVLLQIPHKFYKTLEPDLPQAGSYGTGLVFLPTHRADEKNDAAAFLIELFEKTAELSGLKVLSWRAVPTDPSGIGGIARQAEPLIKQPFLVDAVSASNKTLQAGLPNLEQRLFLFRKRLEKAVRVSDYQGKDAFYIPSLSTRTIVYKGMLMSGQLRGYFTELSDPRLETAVALVHSRFSTNTFPAWPLAQPFRMIAHNGEINTIKGNRLWMEAREALLESKELGKELHDLFPLIEPGRSDSASFDNALELLVLSGRSLPHALMMLIPESWNEKNPIPDELKFFYEYHATFMEPWDGPASIVFCDGRYVGGTLDRNGLRPSRYTVTKNDLIVMASETGVQDFSPREVVYKGRLLPGKLLLVDLEEGRIIPDDEVKRSVYRKKPYAEWVKKQIKALDELPQVDSAKLPVVPSGDALIFMEKAFGYTREDRENLLLPMALSGIEPTSSMGTDTPLAVLSDKSQRVFAYFKQVFAQVTNPPIDSIREELVMTLTSFIGRHKNLLDESEEHCRSLKLTNPILTPQDLQRLSSWNDPDFRAVYLDATFYVRSGGNSPQDRDAKGNVGISILESALDRLVKEAIQAVDEGACSLILTDRAALDPEAGRCAIPALLAAGAVHHGLIGAGRRMLVSIICDSAEPREVTHFALLFGYGADLICPYGALAVLGDVYDERLELEAKKADALVGETNEAQDEAAVKRERREKAEKNYIKGLCKAILKIMSKMGTSTLRSYRGAQVFEALGLGKAVIEKCFVGTASRIGGVGFHELESEAVARLKAARVSAEPLLSDDGQYRWRRGGESHAWNPESIHLLQWATRSGSYKKFKEFTALSNALNRKPHVIRGLIDITAAGAEVPLDEVEPVEAILKRFTTGAMSFGSISKEAHETIAIAMNSIQGRSNSGEGGEDPDRFSPRTDGTWARSAIKQVASGRFGVTSNYLANAAELQIKIAQGAKPGEGGQLPGHKVDALIAKTRHSTPGVTLISPPPHHDIYSIEDLAELIFDLKNANPVARISVKLVSETGVGTVAAGVAKAHADTILISGYDGGTGASPQSSIRHAGLPWELGLAETHQTLVLNGLRGRVTLQTDGQLKTARDIVIAGLLGAEEFGFGTATLIVLGCVMMRKCHENTCPMGVATQDPELRKRFAGKSEYLVNFFRFLAMEVRELLASLGFRRFDELIGRSELLSQASCEHYKAKTLDLSKLLARVGDENADIRRVHNQIHKIDDVLDRKLIDGCFKALDRKTPALLELPIKNTDRAVGAMLSYEVSKRFGEGGLPDNFVTVDFTGSAGQSFGAFLAPGITFRLAGDANDYFGKGLSGGRLVVSPPESSAIISQENIIIGNTALYGATSGEVFVAGVSGERFGVRNSGAIAVVEGTGDHCAEYMTGGRLLVLGPVGRNFAAGMSGGIAYVRDTSGDLRFYLNKGMVELSGLETEEDERFIKDLIRRHVYWTGSSYAQTILDGWPYQKDFFIKVLPVEYKRALQQRMMAEMDRKLFEIRAQEEIEARA